MRVSDGELKKLLADSGQVDLQALEELIAAQAKNKKPLQQLVLERKLISEKELFKLYAKNLGIPFVELQQVKISKDLLFKIPERIANKYQAVLFGRSGNTYQLAMADPEDIQAADFIAKQIGGQVQIYAALPGDISAALQQYKENLDSEISQAIQDSAVVETDEAAKPEKDLAEDAPIAKTVSIILEYAVMARASDVHIEPRENLVQVRYRIDGVLHESMTLPKTLLSAVVSRIKILSNLKIDEHRLPQDGRFKITVGAKTLALRVSTLPVMDGEKVVMRILDESSRPLTLRELGFQGHSLEIIERNLTKPQGMTLVTGPTGSGKSTTLYSVLNMLNSPGVNISTIEDPVEYRIGGVNQTQVNPKAGMTFANGLRALLRQDPNIIMVGEIRDSETADLAIQAALTGHLVLSTLHTNNAATTLPRLLDMGAEPFLIASTVNSVVGQRLVRVLCPTCRVKYVPTDSEIAELNKDFQVEAGLEYYKSMQAKLADSQASAASPAATELTAPLLAKMAADPNIKTTTTGTKTLVKEAQPGASLFPVLAEADLVPGRFSLYRPGSGCDDCGGAAYRGRMGIYEVLAVSPEIGQLIVSRATSDALQTAAVKEGMLTMQQDGFIKSLAGITTIEEILRVTRE